MIDTGILWKFHLGVLLGVTFDLCLSFCNIHGYSSCEFVASLSFNCLSVVSCFCYDRRQFIGQNDSRIYLVSARGKLDTILPTQ